LGAGHLLAVSMLLLRDRLLSQMKYNTWLLKGDAIIRKISFEIIPGIPVFVISVLIMIIFGLTKLKIPFLSISIGPLYLSVIFIVSIIPAALLIQTGYDELTALRRDFLSADKQIMQHLVLVLVTRLLRLTGVLLIVIIFIERDARVPGLGDLFAFGVSGLDFPVIFLAAWILIVIVTLAQFLSEVIKITYTNSPQYSLLK
jgi:hypothetical protein